MDHNEFIFNHSKSERLDKFLAKKLQNYTRTQIQSWIDDDYVTVNNISVKPSFRLKQGDVIVYEIPPVVEADILAQNIPLDIVYEDQDIIVINKESGMVVHPGSGNWQNTLVNALMYHCDDLSGINGVMRAGIVHRIDKDTSGLIVACKNDLSHKNLAKQFASRSVLREYTTLVHGEIPHINGKINAPIGRNPHNRQKMTVIETGKEAITNFSVLKRYRNYTLVLATLETGRTHQIRVHFKYIKYPVVGDKTYGPKANNNIAGGQLLHASKLGFIHPRTKKYIEFTADLPLYFNEFLETLAK